MREEPKYQMKIGKLSELRITRRHVLPQIRFLSVSHGCDDRAVSRSV